MDASRVGGVAVWSAGFAGLVGAVGIALGAAVTVPMEPVPMTLQTLAVVVVGAVLSRPRSMAAVALYLVAALVGLPVLADFTAAPGMEFLRRPGFGYVVGFLPAAAIAREMWGATSLYRQLGWALLAHLVILVCGVSRLAMDLGAASAWDHGFVPFVPGAGVKSAIAVGIVRFASRARG